MVQMDLPIQEWGKIGKIARKNYNPDFHYPGLPNPNLDTGGFQLRNLVILKLRQGGTPVL